MSLAAEDVRFWILKPRCEPFAKAPKPSEMTYDTIICPECHRMFLLRYPGNFSFCPSCKIPLEVPDE